MFLVPSSPNMDWSFFLRPFNTNVWIMYSLLSVILGVFIFVISEFTDYKNSVKWASFSVWFLFVFINAYYGGAVTMFLLSEVDVPFKSLDEAITYHDWKVIPLTDTAIKTKVEQVSNILFFNRGKNNKRSISHLTGIY